MQYVMSDIHGAYDKFIKMLELVNFNVDDTLYILGDCIDRGPDGIKVLQYVMKQSNMELLWGNHEKLMIDYLEDHSFENEYSWFRNGGWVTCESYNALPENEKEELYNYIKNLSYYKIIDNYILCHAGIRVKKNISFKDLDIFLSGQCKNDLLWIREEFYNRKALDGYTVIFGHTPVTYINRECFDEANEIRSWHDKKYKDKICIDCVAHSEYGRLCCLRLEDLKEFYI